MAKRFGRNARRQMREEIAVKNEMLSEALNRSRERGQEAAALRSRLTEWAQEILYLMGEDSAFNEQLARIRHPQHYDKLRLMPVQHLAVMPHRDAAPVYEHVSDVIEACILRCQMKRDDLHGMIAIEIGDHMGPLVGYGLPDDRRKRWSPRDIRYVAELIAYRMAEHLRVEMRKAAA